MPAESGQLRELVERHQQYVRESSSKELQPVQKPKAKLRDSFILTQDEESASVLHSGPDDTPKGLSLKSIIQKHENNSGSNIQTSVERKSTVVKSRSTVTSDGKVSLHRDVIHGEVSSKNNEEPVGKVTRSSYSYQSPKDKDSVPSITSSTTTSLIGSRRSSGPKIEEITDSSTSETNRRFSKEYTVEEEEEEIVSNRRRSSGLSVEENVKVYTSILKNSNEPRRRPSGPRITDVSDVNSEHDERRTSVTKSISSRASPDIQESKTASSNRQQNFKSEERTESQKKVITRGDSVKALQHKFQQATEAANQPTSRPYPRAGLILRSNTLQQIDDQTQMSSSIKQASVERVSSKSKQETTSHDVPTSPVLKTEVITHEDSEVVQTAKVSRTEEPTSFLDNRTKVTGVQDILTRMRNADLVTEKTDTNEDAEARALLNKFLGASVILQGMEQGMRAAQKHSETEGSPTSPSSAALVIQAEKQRVKATTVRTEDDIDDINDEKQLRILIDACSDFEGRRKLRARLRTIMAEQKGGPEDVEESHGEFLGLRNIDDSGIESGEDLKGVNPEVMKEVEEALVRLECILPGLDASRREAVSKLVTSLQSCLRLPPKRRITIGVSAEELAAARKWFRPPLEEMFIEHVNYQPILQRPGYLMEPAPQKAILTYILETEKRPSDSGSLQDYDPSLRLFTPEQTVQIAIHKAAIKKQISQEEGKRRESSDDGDVSSGEESCEVNKYNEVSSAQRLLQIATESAKKNPSAARFHNRSSKKLKMKRANTIDIPKPANFYEYSSGDEYGASADEINIDVERKHFNREIKFLPPTFEPKTENDLKFLAFLKQVNENQPKMQTYNPSARGGKHWNSRFSSIKTTFESTDQPKMSVPSPAKMFWQNSEAHQKKEFKEQYKNKLPWTVKTGDDGVVVGSLTVAKPGHVNNFNHAPKSAFKPIEKKPVSTISGTVKQIAAQKFSVSDSEAEKKQEKTTKKQTNVSHPLSTYVPNTKQNTFVNNTPSAFKKYNTSLQSNHNLPEKSHSKVSAPITNNNHSYNNIKSVDASRFNNEKPLNDKKYNALQNKLPSSNLQNNTKTYQSNISTQPFSNHGYVSKTHQSTLAAKKHFMQTNTNITPQNTGYNPSVHISKPQGSSYSTFSDTVNSINAEYASSISNTIPQNNDNQRPYNITPKKGGYSVPNQISDSKNNGYQSPLHNNNPQKSMHYIANEVVTPRHVTAKPIYNNINDSSCRYPYSSGVYPDAYVDEDYKHSPTMHSEKGFFNIETDDLSILGDSKCKNSQGNLFSENKYSVISKDGGNVLKNSEPKNFEKQPYATYVYSSNNTVNSTDSFDKSSSVPFAYNEKPNYMIQTINCTPPLIKEEPSSPYNLSVSSSLDRISPTRLSNNKLSSDNCYLSPYQNVSPSLRMDEDDSPWGSITNGDDSPLEEKAVSRVMGQAQCQQAVTVNNRTRRRFDADLESELKLQIRQSAHKKSLSPSFPNVIQKSESWHQMVKEQMQQAKQAPPLPKICRAKSSHTLALPKQFEAALPLDTLTQKKITVSQYMAKQSKPAKSTKTNPKYKSTNTINIQRENDELDDVDEVFESIFQESNKKRNSK